MFDKGQLKLHCAVTEELGVCELELFSKLEEVRSAENIYIYKSVMFRARKLHSD